MARFWRRQEGLLGACTEVLCWLAIAEGALRLPHTLNVLIAAITQ